MKKRNRASRLFLIRVALLSTSALIALPALASDYTSVGPAPIQGQDGNPYNTYSGAATDIVVDPADSKTMYVGTTDGGVWVTHDGGTTWTPLTDKQISLSIDSLAADPTDATNKTLIAGTGLLSNGLTPSAPSSPNATRGGLQAGLLYSKDGGTTWTQLGGATLSGQSVDGAAVRGNTILAGTFERQDGGYTGGLYRSTDGGTTFTSISGTGGLPAGPVSALVGDPANNSKFYAAVTAPNAAGKNNTAIYISTDTGTTWTQVFGTANAGGAINATDQTDIRMATGPGNSLAAGIVDVATGKVTGLYYSADGGTTWKSLAIPTNLNTGGQAKSNFTLAIDPNNTNYVYIAGDTTDPAPYVLTAYRVDVAANTDTTMYLTNTADGSSIHPDSRSMAFDASGNLIVSTDGGIYTRTQPQSNSGVWQSLNGNLSAIETYQAAYGANAHLVGVAAQDNSTSLESAAGSVKYNETIGGDGTIATVNDNTLAGKSVYYMSVQNLVGSSQRLIVDSTGTVVDTQNLTFDINPNPGNKEFSVPFVLNKIDPSMIAIGGDNVYLTQDTMTGVNAPGIADLVYTLTKLGGDGNGTTAIAYGTKDNTNALIASVGGTVWMSTSTAGGISALAAYPGQMPVSLVFDTRTQQRFFAADGTDLWGTTDQGATFASLTANLPKSLIRPQALEFVDNNGVDALLVGGLDNAANGQSTVATADSSSTGALSNWRFLGTDLPNAPVNQLVYNPMADVLTVSTFGRGVWLMYDFTSNYSSASVLQFGLAGNDSTPDASLLTGNRPLVKYGSGTLTITGAATYTGGTTINAGTLQLGNGGTGGSITGDIVDNGSLKADRSDTLTLSGAISGTGAFTQMGTGTTIFTGADSYGGGTTVAAGTLQIGNGGTTGSVSGNIADNSQVVIDLSSNASYSGVISGTGGLAQSGTGTFTLTGTNTYTGATTVNAGTLSVNGSITSSSGVTVANGGTLGGTGTVPGTTVANGGTLAAGNSIGTLHINGNLTLSTGSTVNTELSTSSADEIIVTGTAGIAGHLILTSTSASYTAGAKYTIVNSGGALSGTFGDVVFSGSFGATLPTVSYDANDIFVTMAAVTQIAWSATPGTSDWNTGSNWVTGTVPTATDIAMFNASTKTSVDIQQANTKIGEMLFNAGAPAYTFNVAGTAAGASSLVIGGNGIVDSSGNAPSFMVWGVAGDTGTLEFDNSASAGDATITANSFGTVMFTGMTDASGAKLTTGTGGTVDISGISTASFNAGSIAGSGSFVLGSKMLSVGSLNTSTMVSGVISGTGSLMKVGTGTLTLTGANTYTGGTTVNGGALQIGAGGTSGSVTGNIADNGQLIFDRSDAVSFGGVISGTGTFAQMGGGTTILTAMNTYTGATTVMAGTLQVDGSIVPSGSVLVNAGGTLQGSGAVASVTVASGGTLSPGAGMGNVGHLSVSGNATLGTGSNLQIDTGANGTDMLSVSGTLNIGGTAMFNAYSTPHYGDSAIFASASAINGSFGSVPDTLSGVLYPSVSVMKTATGQDLVVTIDAGSFLTELAGASQDVKTIGAALDAARGLHYSDLKAIYDSVDTLSDGPLTTALTDLVPSNARTLPQISALQMGAFDTLISDHLADFSNGSASSGMTAFRVDTGALNLALQNTNPGTEASNMLAAAVRAGDVQNMQPIAPTPAEGGDAADFGKGLSGFLVGSSLDGSVAAGGGQKAKANGYLIAAGLDYQVNTQLVVGAALSYANSSEKMSAAQTRSHAIQGVVYGHYSGNGWFANGFAGTSGQHFTTARTVVTGGTTFNLTGQTNGATPTVGASVGIPFVESGFTIAPAAGLQWQDASTDGYTETGGAAAMTYQNFSRSSVLGNIGFDASGNVPVGTVSIEPMLHAYLVHDFDSTAGTITGAFVQAPNATMAFALAQKSTTWVELGIGAEMAVGNNTNVSVHYDATAGRSDLFSGAWTGQLNVQF
ncbi:MAG: autotransporter-associated beta strand repeat-containing protein [Alphaproteobacteria bacterium]|nr:autotransporter-associated beta strand repeat-containing protein [Alphaproteobacteria bacterium]